LEFIERRIKMEIIISIDRLREIGLEKIDNFMALLGYLPDDEKYDDDTKDYTLSYFRIG
jgi:hypothetical protein